ncbi:MAG: condensation domain-containing protein, partial [Longimicrobiales bacterium]|nr:condensation domain-containing protein [Longimicrobiales bacterium]
MPGSPAPSEAPPETPSSATGGSNLSRSQLMIWTGQQLDPDTPLYNMIYRFDLLGAVDPDVFRRAFQALVDRTDAMRTVFEDDDGVPAQRVLDTLVHPLQVVDLSGEASPEAALDDWVRERGRRILDLGRCTFDSALIRTGPDRYTWYLNQHHLTIDAWSGTLVFRNMADLYRRLSEGEGLAEVSYPAFGDYLDYEESIRSSKAYASAVTYWKERTEQVPARPAFYGRSSPDRVGRTERVSCRLGAERSRRLRALAETPGIRALSMHMTLFNIFATVLTAYVW